MGAACALRAKTSGESEEIRAASLRVLNAEIRSGEDEAAREATGRYV